MLRQSSYNRHWMERQAGLDFNCSWAARPRTCLTHTLKVAAVWFWQGTLEACPYFSSSCEPGHQLLLLWSLSFTSNWCRKSLIEAWHWEEILIRNSTINSYSLSGSKNAKRLEKNVHRTCDCPEFKFWTDVTGLWAGGSAVRLLSLLFFSMAWYWLDPTWPFLFLKAQWNFKSFYQIFCVCVCITRAIFQVNRGNMKRWCKPL